MIKEDYLIALKDIGIGFWQRVPKSMVYDKPSLQEAIQLRSYAILLTWMLRFKECFSNEKLEDYLLKYFPFVNFHPFIDTPDQLLKFYPHLWDDLLVEFQGGLINMHVQSRALIEKLNQYLAMNQTKMLKQSASFERASQKFVQTFEQYCMAIDPVVDAELRPNHVIFLPLSIELTPHKNTILRLNTLLQQFDKVMKPFIQKNGLLAIRKVTQQAQCVVLHFFILNHYNVLPEWLITNIEQLVVSLISKYPEFSFSKVTSYLVDNLEDMEALKVNIVAISQADSYKSFKIPGIRSLQVLKSKHLFEIISNKMLNNEEVDEDEVDEWFDGNRELNNE